MGYDYNSEKRSQTLTVCHLISIYTYQPTEIYTVHIWRIKSTFYRLKKQPLGGGITQEYINLSICLYLPTYLPIQILM